MTKLLKLPKRESFVETAGACIDAEAATVAPPKAYLEDVPLYGVLCLPGSSVQCIYPFIVMLLPVPFAVRLLSKINESSRSL